MLSTISNTLSVLESELLIKFDQMNLQLDIEGVFDDKNLALIILIKKLLNDSNVSDEDKLRLNYKLLNIKNIKVY